MSGPDAVLRDLHAGGFSVLAGGLEGVRPQQNEPMPGVLNLQQRYTRLPGNPLTAAFTGSLVVAAPLPAHEGGAVQVAVTFDVVQAPSAFCLPVMQKRPWDPPFQVRMTWRSTLPLQFSTTVAAFVADESAVPSMLTWQLPSPGDAAKALMDYQQERMVVLLPAGDPSGGCVGVGGMEQLEHSAEAVFTFSKLAFGAPSQMRPRWLVFAASLLGGGCVFSHYKVPTVAMSRLAEQFEKAKAVLWGSQEPPSCDTSLMKMDYGHLRKYIKRQLISVGIHREPSEADYRYLAARAGFVTSPSGVRSTSASLEELAAFKQWFADHLIMLKHIRPHYERTDPLLVCGFGTTREQADALLAPHAVGTFLLRFGSQGGQLVLSVRGPGVGSAGITHYSIPSASLQLNGLEALLERNGAAEQLLDAATGQRHYRTTVLDRSYVQAVDVAEARKRYRQPQLPRRMTDVAESASPSESQPRGLSSFQHGPPPPSAAQQHQQHLQRVLSETPSMIQGAASGPLHSLTSLAGAMPERMDSIASAGSRLRSQPPMQAGASAAGPGRWEGQQQVAQQAQQQQQQQQQQFWRSAAGMQGTGGLLAAAAVLNPYASSAMLCQPSSSSGAPGGMPGWHMQALCAGDPPAPALTEQQQQQMLIHQQRQQQQPHAMPPPAHQAGFGWGSPLPSPHEASQPQPSASLSMQQAGSAAEALVALPGAAAAAIEGPSCRYDASQASSGSRSENSGTPSIGPLVGPAQRQQRQQRQHQQQRQQQEQQEPEVLRHSGGQRGGILGGDSAAMDYTPAALLRRGGSSEQLLHMQHASLAAQQAQWLAYGGAAGGAEPLPNCLRGLHLRPAGGGDSAQALASHSAPHFQPAGPASAAPPPHCVSFHGSSENLKSDLAVEDYLS